MKTREQVLEGMVDLYDGTKQVGPGLYCVWKNDLRGLFSVSVDKLVIPVEYFVIIRFTDDLYEAQKKNGLRGLFSVSAGKLVIPEAYNHISKFTDDLYEIWRGDSLGLFSVSADRLVLLVEYNLLSKFADDLYLVRKNGLRGLFSISAKKLVIPVEYTKIEIKDDLVIMERVVQSTKPLKDLF
jgi:hypothetical protein